ncbi:hypothetical protein HY230_08060 [Candidatus Acetothermia bacterium]|nr:hypothetical protein [Candidatus Acetothermia bacterium]
MKWGEETDRVSERTMAALLKVFGPYGLYILLLITSFVLLSGADDKLGG